ncbi:acyl-CoA--6-aminopenicillanic acid acyl transferase [Lachnospiraceae bacterium]|nr:acyl-CoA--6-aminopenicillanic acid acyl transferase [Lachnospiraceae bacterium]HAT02843.1 type II toxin-antitoxin system antitoxin, RelB/DinJ family [Oribacterium sp.]
MAVTKSNMTIRIDPELKKEASSLFKSLGLDLSTATGIFYRQALRCHGLPFDVKADEPNAVTYAAMEEAEQMLKDPNTRKFSSIDELFAELNA